MSTTLPPEPDWASLPPEEAHDLATQRLSAVMAHLKATKKALLRDWHNLTPEKRSHSSREVKQLEEQQKTLNDILEVTHSHQ